MSRDAELRSALQRLAPQIPRHESGVVVDQAMDSRGLRHAQPEVAVWLALVAYVRHAFTDYDELLASGYDFESARHFALPEMERVLAAWGVRRPVSAADFASEA